MLCVSELWGKLREELGRGLVDKRRYVACVLFVVRGCWLGVEGDPERALVLAQKVVRKLMVVREEGLQIQLHPLLLQRITSR